jgi:hypothetical protein
MAKTLKSFKRMIKVGKRYYNYYDAHGQYRRALAQKKKLKAKGYNVVIRKYKVPQTGGTTWHVFTCRRKK